MSKIPDIVDILISCQQFLKMWFQFTNKLKCPVDKMQQWKIEINNSNLDYYTLFWEIMHTWISGNGQKTVRDLCDVLKDMHFNYLAGFSSKEIIPKKKNNKNVFVVLTNLVGPSPNYFKHTFGFDLEKLEMDVGEDCTISIDGRQNGSNKLFQDPGPGKKIKYPITHGLLVNAANFSGREKELNEINEHFKSMNNLVLVCGLGGIGKTELCKKFANETCLTDNVRISRVWLHGETFDTLTNSIQELANYLGVSNETNLSVYFNRIVHMILENSDRLLVIIDNVDEKYDEVIQIAKTIKNTNNKRMCIIVTSRDSLVLGSGLRFKILLDGLSKIEARVMMQKSIEGLNDPDADKLGELVQYFPLALQQAVAFIIQQRAHFRTQNYSVSDYVREFEMKKESMLGQKLDEIEHDYEKTTSIVWNMTFDKIKIESEDAEGILKVVSHLDPDFIELYFLEKICTHRKFYFDKGFDIIHKYCIVKLNTNVKRKMYSIHRLLQDVLRQNCTQEYARALFDDIFVVSVGCNPSAGRIITTSESFHLQSLCKYANLKWDSHSYIRFENVLLIPLELNRLNCALECIKLKYPHLIESNPTDLSEEMKKELIEKFVFWYVMNGVDDKKTKEIIINGEYIAYDNYKNVNLIEAWKMSIKYFGIKNKQQFLAIKKLVQKVCLCHGIDKAIEICDGFINFQFDSEKKLIYFGTISHILEALDKKRAVEIQQVERVEKIVAHFSKSYPKSVELIGLLEAMIFYFKDDYAKAHDLIKQFLPKLKQHYGELVEWRYEELYRSYQYTEMELKIKTINFAVLTREKTEREFGKADLNKLSLRGLEKIEKILEDNLGKDDPLTVKIKVAVANKLCYTDREKCIKLCELVLNSPVDTYYGRAFRNLCNAKTISGNYDEQKVILEKLLAEKESLGENHSNLITVKQLLAKTMEEFGDLPRALELFEQVKKSAVDCGWGENDLKKSQTNVARVKLRIGDFSSFNTREDIYREFGEFDNYELLSFEQLQKILPFYKKVLGNDDKLTLELKLDTALKLHNDKQNCKAFLLLEEMIGSEGNEDLIQRVYALMFDIGCGLYKNGKNYVKAKEVLEKVLQYQTQIGQNVNKLKIYLAHVEKLITLKPRK